MINTRIFYTTNAGLYFSCGNSEILVDGIHDAGTVGFTPMPDEMKKQMASEEGLFAGQGALLFTHLHEDHYDEDMVREYIEQHPETALCGPGLESKGITDIGGNENEYRYHYRDFNIIAYKTKHSGSKRMDVPHYSLLLKNTGSDEVFFVAGDAVLEPKLADRIHRQIERCSNGLYAFVMAYQLAERKSKAFIDILSPARIFLIHQPRPDDEAYSKVSRIKSFAVSETPGGTVIEEPEPMSWII